MTIEQAVDMISRGETSDQYKKRMDRIRRLTNERDFLEDAIEVLGDDPRVEQKRKRLKSVMRNIKKLTE